MNRYGMYLLETLYHTGSLGIQCFYFFTLRSTMAERAGM